MNTYTVEQIVTGQADETIVNDHTFDHLVSSLREDAGTLAEDAGTIDVSDVDVDKAVGDRTEMLLVAELTMLLDDDQRAALRLYLLDHS